jgi:hypothetical protein
MKSIAQHTVFVLALTMLHLSATAQVILQSVEERANAGSYPVDARLRLGDREASIEAYARQHPEALRRAGLNKPDGWGFSVGSTKIWYADDLTPDEVPRYQVASTCRAVGTNCYIFVEDASWGSRVTQAAVDSVAKAFDLSTPANPSKGIFQMDVEAFGDPLDVDGDSKIIILILDIRDGFTGSGGYVVGYYYSYNEFPVSAQTPTSNVAEIYFLDCDPLNLASAVGIGLGMSTAAHEFQHMIHFNYNRLSDTFTNEGCSVIAEVNCGYPIYDQTLWANETNHRLFDWRRSDIDLVLNDYSRAARFFLYFKEQFGMGIFKDIVQIGVSTGSTRLDGALASHVPVTARRFAGIFPDWLIANMLNDVSVDPKWGYSYAGIGKAVPKAFLSPNVSSTIETIQPLGAAYYSFSSGTSLTVNISSNAGPGWAFTQAIETGPGGKRVLPVTPGTPFVEAEFGTTYTDVTFVVGNVNPTSVYNVTYSATGEGGTSAVELKWDQGEPTGYLLQSAGDTVAVTFDAVPGAKLDSVRVALRRACTIAGGVWKLSSTTRSPLGAPLAVPITASIATTPGVPYPVPWPNWVTVDLRSKNISAATAFAVGFVYTGVGSAVGDPRVMPVGIPGTSPYYSFSYLNNSGSGVPDWYYLSKNADSIWVYMIRAYVSFGPTDAPVMKELLPSAQKLYQNYPNPFNPSTTIGFSIPSQCRATLKIFNLLGQEGETLIDDVYAPGRYNVQWHPAGLAAGIYLYRLQAGSYIESRKLLYLR